MLNAGAGIYAANGADSIAEGVFLAAEAIDSGRAEGRPRELVALTQEFGAGIAARQAAQSMTSSQVGSILDKILMQTSMDLIQRKREIPAEDRWS